MDQLILVILSIILPPIGVAFKEGIGFQFLLNVVLTIFGYLPGLVHALYVVLK